jgi:hypothetical protein
MITLNNYANCRRTIQYLLKQTAVQQIELILAGPSRQQMQVDDRELLPFHSVQIVEIRHLQSTGQAMASAVRVAKAPYAAPAEEHDYPEPTWAETIIDLFDQGGYGAVGWSMANPNPGWVSWAHMYGQFGPVIVPVTSREATSLSGHHAAYRRDLLLNYGDLLPELLNNEIMLQKDLYRRGHKLFLTGEAVSRHVNISKLSTYFHLDYIGQRGFAATRVKVLNWSWARRILYAGGAPLVPFLRLYRSLRDIRRTERTRSLLPHVAILIFMANIFGAVGEAFGYLFGAPNTLYETRIPMELNRSAYVRERDKQVF